MMGAFDEIAPLAFIMVVTVALLIGFAPIRRILQSAFTFTFFGLLFFLTGAFGYAIRKSGGLPYLDPVANVVWRQLWLGLVCFGSAIVLWRRALTAEELRGRSFVWQRSQGDREQ